MPKFRKKPVVIEAFRVAEENENVQPMPLWAIQKLNDGLMDRRDDGCFVIRTLEGTMVANRGDYIIQGVKGELYPCKPDIFAATYEPLEG